MSALACVALALCLWQAAPQARPAPGSVGPTLDVWPDAVRLFDGRSFPSDAPLALAIELAAPGALVRVLPGDYGPMSLGVGGHGDARALPAGGNAAMPILVRAEGRVRLLPRGAQDTLTIGQTRPFSHVRFEGFEIHAGSRAAVMFHRAPANGANRGFHFIDCVVDGGFDHVTDRGLHSKWAFQVWDPDDFVFAGVRRRAVVRNVCHEHAFYVQHPRGDVRIENVDAQRLGRTFLQVTARASSGPPGRGRLVVRGNRIEDTGISGRDNFKGGTALTFAGRLEAMEILVESNRVRSGFTPELRWRTLEGAPYGTAALVAWGAGEDQPNGHLILRGNHFEFAPGAGDRPLVSIAATRRATLEGNRFLAGEHPVALEFDPPGEDGRARDRPNGPIALGPENQVRGQVTRLGRPLAPERWADLGRAASDR